MGDFSQKNCDFRINWFDFYLFCILLSLFHTVFIIRKLYKNFQLCVSIISITFVNCIKFLAVLFEKIGIFKNRKNIVILKIINIFKFIIFIDIYKSDIGSHIWEKDLRNLIERHVAQAFSAVLFCKLIIAPSCDWLSCFNLGK